MTSVFISYSRTDQAFVRRLYDALAGAGRDAWVDWEDIPPTAEWLKEVYTGLEAADAFICVLSPDWANSAVSQKELTYALEAHKRIVPLVCREVAPETIAAPVRDLNWIFFRPSDDFENAFRQLLFALETDLDYWHLSSRLQVRAHEWEQSHEKGSTVLRGKELAAAESWLAAGADKQPTPTALQTRYITASRRASGARQRTWIGLLSAGLLITLVLATVAQIERARADSNANQLAAQNKVLFAQVLAGEANADLVGGNVDQSLLLSVAASKRLDSVETRDALLNGLEYSPHLAATLDDTIAGQAVPGLGAAVAFSRDGRTILTANGENINTPGYISLWDATTHQLRRRFAASNLLLDANFSADGQMVAFGDPNTGFSLWDVTTGTELGQLIPGLSDLTDVARGAYDVAGPGIVFSPNGQVLATGYCDNVTCAHPSIGLWDIHSRTALGQLPLVFPPNYLSLAFSPDGTRLAATECDFGSVDLNCQIELWDWANKALLYTHPITPADGGGYGTTMVVFSPDGQTLATSSCSDLTCAMGQILTWNAATGTRDGPALNSPRREPFALAFSPDGHTMAAGYTDGLVTLWDLASGQPDSESLVGHHDVVRSIAFNADGRSFVTTGEDGKVLLWRLGEYSSFSLPLGPNLDGSSQVAITPDGKTLATAGCDGKARLWDLASGVLRATLTVPGVDNAFCMGSLAFSGDGSQLAAGTDFGPVLTWDTQTHEVVSACVCSAGFVKRVVFSPDGLSVAVVVVTNEQSAIELVDLQSGNVTHTYAVGLARTSLGVAFSPDGSLLAMGGGGPNQDGINVWATHSGQIAVTLPEVSTEAVGALAFSPDGHVLAALSATGHLSLWNMQTHALLASTAAVQPIAANADLAFRSDGHMLAMSFNNTITLLDVHDLKHPATYVRQFNEPHVVQNAVFSPDGKLLIDAVEDGPVNVRYATLGGWQSAACVIANRNLSKTEWQQFFGSQSNERYQNVCPGQ